MISSNSRARKWFEDQARQRTIEQMVATLNQVLCIVLICDRQVRLVEKRIPSETK